MTGLEPVRPREQQILSLQRLPFRHMGVPFNECGAILVNNIYYSRKIGCFIENIYRDGFNTVDYQCFLFLKNSHDITLFGV